MNFRDYYDTLGVMKDAGAEDIKKAFRRLARRYHPDVSKEANAEARMKAINEAFDVLSDPDKRAAYDQLGQGFRAGQEFRAPPNWDAGFDFSARTERGGEFSDFFSELFGSRAGTRRGAAGSAKSFFQARGQDHHAKILLDVEDAWRGGRRTINLRVPRPDASGRMRPAEQQLEVAIPQGVREGQTLRLAGQGAPGTSGGAPGDLYLEVRFKPHARYRVEGRDVYASLPVAPWEAALGATIKAPVPNGTVEVKIPEGSQSGRKLRLKGRGIPGTPPGDLYLVTEIVLPPAANPRARKFYETMAREMPFNPRQALGV